MTVSEYFETVKAHLLTNPLVENFQIVRERIAANDGHIRVRMKLINSNLIEFSEYIQLHAGDISPNEIREVLLSGEIIENYPKDKYGPILCIHSKCYKRHEKEFQ